jgi:hypothetical protein
MSALSLESPFPIFTDIDGNPLEDGYIYIGTAGLNAETNPIQAYWDTALAIPAAQPIRTSGGYPVRTGSPARIYVSAEDYSLTVRNKNGSLIFSSLNITERIPASIVTFIQAGAGAVSRTIQAKARELVSVKDFGAVGDGVTNDSAAFTAWAAAIDAQGGATALIPPGTYKVLLPISGALCAFTAATDGLVILAAGAIIDDQQVYGALDDATFMRFTASKNIDLARGLRFQTTRNAIAYTGAHGSTGFEFLQGCEGIDLDYEQDGGLNGVKCSKAAVDPASYVSRQIRVRLKGNRIHYPYIGSFSGDGVTLDLDVLDCGRNFFIYGVAQNAIRVRSKNQKVASLIKAYSGYGCSDVTVEYYDRDSDSCNAAAPVIGIEWGDLTAATHKNIKLNVDLANPVASPWGNSIAFAKYSDGGSTADAVGRGHILDGFVLSGVSENVGTGKNHVNNNAGSFAAPDVIRNVGAENLSLRGVSSFSVYWFALSGEAVFKNVNSDRAIYTQNAANGKVVFIGCKVNNFVGAAANTDRHDYISCEIADATDTSTATNKTYINTYLAGVLKNILLGSQAAPSFKLGTIAKTAVKALSGDLTGTNNIFFVSPALGTGAMIRIRYFLVADQSDFDPGTRDETFGVKSLTAIMTSGGVWGAITAQADEIAERTKGTASVVTVSLVNGTAAGAYIAVACTNYNSANARGYFEAELISMLSNETVELAAA